MLAENVINIKDDEEEEEETTRTKQFFSSVRLFDCSTATSERRRKREREKERQRNNLPDVVLVLSFGERRTCVADLTINKK